MSDENSRDNTNENTSEYKDATVNAGVNAQKLEIMDTLREGVDFSVKNIGPLLVNLLLWVLTIWIPYLNVGTTIGLFTGIVSKISREETISFTEIFDPKYRKYMGEFFLTAGLVFIGTFIGILFLLIPGIIMSIAWSFALLLVIDKGKTPTESLTLSNNITYGYKWRIFLINFIVSLIFSIIQTVLNNFDNSFAVFILIISVVFQLLLTIGIQASMYKQLAKNI